MHIVVCIKQVPDSAQIRVHPVTNTIMRQGVPTIINPYDLFALEEALRLRDNFGGEVTVLTMGPPSAEDSLRKALTFGADRAVLLTDRLFAGADTLATTYALAAADPQDRRDLRHARHRLHRQADDRRRHRPGRPRHRQAPRPRCNSPMSAQIEYSRSAGAQRSRSSGARKAACRCCRPAALPDHHARRRPTRSGAVR